MGIVTYNLGEDYSVEKSRHHFISESNSTTTQPPFLYDTNIFAVLTTHLKYYICFLSNVLFKVNLK